VDQNHVGAFARLLDVERQAVDLELWHEMTLLLSRGIIKNVSLILLI
jgi:hypothetical protein